VLCSRQSAPPCSKTMSRGCGSRRNTLANRHPTRMFSFGYAWKMRIQAIRIRVRQGGSSAALTMLKMAAFAPMPSASVSMRPLRTWVLAQRAHRVPEILGDSIKQREAPPVAVLFLLIWSTPPSVRWPAWRSSSGDIPRARCLDVAGECACSSSLRSSSVRPSRPDAVSASATRGPSHRSLLPLPETERDGGGLFPLLRFAPTLFLSSAREALILARRLLSDTPHADLM